MPLVPSFPSQGTGDLRTAKRNNLKEKEEYFPESGEQVGEVGKEWVVGVLSASKLDRVDGGGQQGGGRGGSLYLCLPVSRPLATCERLLAL